MMRVLLGTTMLAGLLVAGGARAADMPLKAPPAAAYYNWSGLYIGSNSGGGWADTTDNFLGTSFTAERTRLTGALAGGQIGYNMQWGNWVLGAELTGDWSDLRDSITVGSATFTTKLHNLETLTGRLGYAANNWLFYVKGGGASGDVSVQGLNTIGDTLSTSRRLPGYTVGAGIEHGLTRNLIFGVEYDYASLSHHDFNPVSARGLAVPFSESSFKVQSVLGRLSYKFF